MSPTFYLKLFENLYHKIRIHLKKKKQQNVKNTKNAILDHISSTSLRNYILYSPLVNTNIVNKSLQIIKKDLSTLDNLLQNLIFFFEEHRKKWF